MRTRIVYSLAAPAALLCLWGTFLAPAARAQTYTGYLDGATCASIGGWAWDGTEAQIAVDLLDGSTPIQTVTANQPRSDLVGVAGSGNHGYGIVTPDSLKDNQPHTIHARYHITGVELTYSPRTFSCAYDGYLNGVTPLTINGWGWKVNSNDRMPINLYDGNQLVLQTTANQYRADLAGIGDGSHAYRAAPTGTMNNGQDHYIYARIADQGTLIDLQYSPMLLHPSPTPVYEGHFDVASCDMLAGWVTDENHPLNRFTVAFYEGASLLPFTATANLFRQDLLDAQLGDGTYAFSIATPPWLKDGATHQITAQMQASGFVLTGSPKTLGSCQPPPVVSVMPAAGSGSAQTFTVNAFNSAGAANISYAYLLVNASLSAASGCFVEYNHVANTFRLQNDAGTAWLGPITPGSAASLSNSQCTITGSGASIVGFGNYLSVTIPTSFAFAFGGAKTSFGYDYDNAMNGSGWITTGSWTVPSSGPPAVVSALPASGSGLAQTFTLTVADGAGTANISYAYFLVNSALSAASGCEIEFNRGGNTLRLQNDAGSAWLGPITLGSGSLANSQCTISGNGASSVATGNNLTITIPATFAFAFVGAKTVFGYAFDNAMNGSGWVTTGTWTALPPPTVVSALPASGTGSGQTFSLKVADSAGALNIGYAYLLINSSLSGFNGCWVEYNRAANTLRLQNDAYTAWLGPITLGSAVPLANSQCSISGSGASGVANGNNLTVTIPISFAGAFAGVKTVFGYAFDNAFNGSDWITTGTWTVTDFTISVTPATSGSSAVLAGLGATYTVTVTSKFGFGGTVAFLPSGVTGLPTGVSASFSPQSITPPVNGSISTTMTIGTTRTDAGGVTGNYAFTVTGASGSLAHSGAGSLAIQDFVLQFTPASMSVARPVTGSSTVSFTVTAAGVNGFRGTIGLSLLIVQGYGLPPYSSMISPGGSISTEGSTTLTVVLYASNAASSLTPFQLSGTYGYIAHTQTATLTVTSNPDFSVSVSPGVQTVTLPTTTSPPYSISISSSGGFGGPVTFSAASSPAGVTASFSPPSVSGAGTTSMTLYAPPGVAGTYALTITASSGSTSHQAPVTLGVQAATSGLPYPTQSAILSMFVERHQWLVSAGAGAGLYNLPDNDQSTVSAVVASTKQQLDQLQSQVGSYAGRGSDYADARNGILQGFKSQLRSGLASPSSWPTLDAYMNSVVSPRISMVPLTVGGSNDCVQNTNCCPSGLTCQNMWSEVNFYGGGLGGRVDSWVEGPDAINFCSTVSGVKGTYIAANGSPADIGIPGGPTNTACNGGRAFKGYTTPTPQPGTYKIETFHSFTGNGQSFPPFSALLSSGSVPPPATWVFNTSNGYDMYQTPVGLSLQVAGAQMDETGQIATVSNCSSPIVVAVVFTPPVPDYNKPPAVTWTGGSTGQDNLHQTVPCAIGTTQVAAAIGSLLLAQVQVQVQPSLTINPSTIVAAGSSQFSVTATSTIPNNGTYTWEIISTQAGDDPTIAHFSQSPSCNSQGTCAAALQGASHSGTATVRVHLKSQATGVDVAIADARVTTVSIASLQVTQPTTPDAVTGIAPYATPPVSTNMSLAFATAEVPDLLTVLKDSGIVTVSATNIQPAANANLIQWKLDRDPNDTVDTAIPVLSGAPGAAVAFQPSTAGNFRLAAYLDVNSNGVFDEGEQVGILRIAIVQVTLEPGAIFNTANTLIAAGTSGVRASLSLPYMMSLTANYLLEGGGSTRIVGTGAVVIGDVGNLLADTFTVGYPVPIPVPGPPGNVTGTAVEVPAGPMPMVDSLADPSGGTTAFRSNSSIVDSPLPAVGREVQLYSLDAPAFAWSNLHPTTRNAWGSTNGSNQFREFILAFSNSFFKTYLPLNRADWTVTAIGSNNGIVWVDTASSVTGNATLQDVGNAVVQVLGRSFVNNYGMRYAP